MNKQRVALTVAAVALVAAIGYVAYRWYQARKSAPGGGQLGTNLNSVAPELVGGSSGPEVGPAVQLPVNITLNETSPAPVPQGPEREMMGVNAQTANSPLYRQSMAVSPGIINPADTNSDFPQSPNDMTEDTTNGNGEEAA